MRILTLSELYPNPARPAFGIFIERQVFHLKSTCENIVVSPVRVFPHLRLWIYLFQPNRLIKEWREWISSLKQIPSYDHVNGIPVYYPRYTSPPKQGFHGTWGFFAYIFLRRFLQSLHEKYQFELIHAHYASPCGVIAILAQRWMKIPVILSIHGADITYTVKQNAVSRAIIRWVLKKANCVIANSSWTAQEILSLSGSSQKVEIVRYGGNPSQDIGIISPREDQTNVIVLSVGYLEKRKGHEYVLRALKELANQGYKFRYIVVGDGSKLEMLRHLANQLEISSLVSFEGYKSHEDIWRYFADCDIFVLPSWNEAFGVVYIEALYYGKPVIGCEGEGGPEDLKSLGECIQLVRPRNVESLVTALKILLDNPDLRKKMGETGRRIVEEHYTWEGNAEETLRIFRETLKHYGA